MSDVRGHTVSWLAGYAYVGNNTLGANDSVYFVDPTGTDIVVAWSGESTNGNVPVAMADSLVGATYASDVEKHYARKRISSVKLACVPLFPATTNSMSVIIAPQRGAKGVGKAVTDTSAANAYTNVLSMAGSKQCASWEGMEIDMTSCIAGGSGSAQNEFDVSAGDDATTEVSNGGSSYLGVVPCTFCLSGNNSTAALRGTKTHAIILTVKVDFIDFIGGNIAVDPEVQRQHRLKSRLCPNGDRKDCKSELLRLKSDTSPSDRKDPPPGGCSVSTSLSVKSKQDTISASPMLPDPAQLIKLGYVKVEQGGPK